MPLWAWALVSLVASFVLQSVLVKPPKPQKPASLADFDFPQSDEGTPQAVCFGDNWTAGWFVMWWGNLRTKKIKAGGKK